VFTSRSAAECPGCDVLANDIHLETWNHLNGISPYSFKNIGHFDMLGAETTGLHFIQFRSSNPALIRHYIK
jgi:hypothetical protein